MRRALPLLALLLAGCAGERASRTDGGDLSGLLAFADPAQCQAGPALDRLLRSLLRDTTSLPVKYGPVEVPDRYRADVGAARLARWDGMWEATATLRGRWLGLPMAGVAARGYDGGDGAGFGLLFRAGRAETLAAVRRAGFRPSPPGPNGPRPDWKITVTRAGAGLSSLDCSLNG